MQRTNKFLVLQQNPNLNHPKPQEKEMIWGFEDGIKKMSQM
jgi:hypothetical protein